MMEGVRGRQVTEGESSHRHTEERAPRRGDAKIAPRGSRERDCREGEQGAGSYTPKHFHDGQNGAQDVPFEDARSSLADRDVEHPQ